MTEDPSDPGATAEPIAGGASERAAAWLRARLTGDQARDDWRRLLEAGWQHVLDTRLDALLTPEIVLGYVEAHLEPERLAAVVRPVARSYLSALAAGMRADQEPLARYVPDDARRRIEAIVTRPGFVHEAWTRALFKEKAIEELLADSLYRGLRDFSTIIPRLVLRAVPKLPVLGRAGALGEKIAHEIEKVLEPEIKSFIAGGSQRVLDRAAEFAVAHADDPAAVELRRNTVSFILSKAPSFHASGMDDATLTAIDQAAEGIARHAAVLPETRERARRVVRAAFEKHGARPLKDVLADLAIDSAPPFDALASVTWPFFRTYLESPTVSAWVGGIAADLLASADPAARR